MKKERKRISTTAALMLRIGALVLALWLGAMVYLTVIAAIDLRNDWRSATTNSVDKLGDSTISPADMIENSYYKYYANIDFPVISGLSALHGELTFYVGQNGYYSGPTDSFESYDYHECTTVYFRYDDDLFIEEGNYATLTLRNIVYINDDPYHTHSEEYECVINVDDTPVELMKVLQSLHYDGERHKIYIYGYYERVVFVPLKVCVQIGENKPQVLYDNSASIDVELVCLGSGINTDNTALELTTYQIKTNPITVDGKTYANLQELAKVCRVDSSNLSDDAKDNLWKSVIIGRNRFTVSYNYSFGDSNASESDDFFENDGVCIAIAICYPIKAAMHALLPTYLVTFLVISLILLLLWRRIRNRLTKPLQHVIKYTQKDYAAMPHIYESRWQEPYELEDRYLETQQTIRQLRQDNQQLQTALDYAKDAEVRRRELISNITHELKTPLAVIHSYAEGLSEGIAEDKKDQYLNIILDEAQRMDGMVLEMLDLSRLEAGKVRLASDTFCLSDLTKQIFEKLSFLVQEKELTVNYALNKFDITADESRIAQVITNFATNAIKYSPQGGQIQIRSYQYGGKTVFRIENQCEPLPPEALEHIWDSFYRTDASRSSKGTGLGLAIAKSIIELHRGTCSAENTRDGVQFTFTLP